MRRLILPLLTTLLLVLTAGGLGIWQLHRLEWKNRILAQIDRAERAPPVPLSDHPAMFQKILIRGRLDPLGAISYADDVRDDARGNAVQGTFLAEPLLRPGLAPVLVDLGWVTYPPRPVAGEVLVIGYVRPSEPATWLSAPDDPAGRRYYTLETSRIAAGIGRPDLAPFVVIALGAASSPDPARSLPRPPNDHLQYAITWFSLAVVCVLMFLAWLRSTCSRGTDPE